MEILLVVIVLAVPASVLTSILRERRAARASAASRSLPCASLDDPPDDRAKAMPALKD